MIWACFHPKMDLKATKMAFMANHLSRIFSKVVFMLVLRYIYYPISFVSQIHFVMLGDICSYLCCSACGSNTEIRTSARRKFVKAKSLPSPARDRLGGRHVAHRPHLRTPTGVRPLAKPATLPGAQVGGHSETGSHLHINHYSTPLVH